MRTSAICAMSILFGAQAAVAAPTVPAVGPMTAVDVPLLGRATYPTGSAPSTVWTGKEFFAVWNDWRDPQQSQGLDTRVAASADRLLLIDPSVSTPVATG